MQISCFVLDVLSAISCIIFITFGDRNPNEFVRVTIRGKASGLSYEEAIVTQSVWISDLLM
jgi:hypothetical protein